MASSIVLQVQALQLQGTPKRSQFLVQNIPNISQRPCSSVPRKTRLKITCAKFDLFQLLGGRGLCHGEKGLQQELERRIEVPPDAGGGEESSGDVDESPSSGGGVPEDGFGKEMMGLTGGFPGGEAGLLKFIQENPPPKKQSSAGGGDLLAVASSKKPKPPELPLLMPGMIVIVKNPNSPFHMYFRLEELERREKGPPGKNPKSAVIEPLINQEPQG